MIAPYLLWLCVRLSVRPSVTSRCFVDTAQWIERILHTYIHIIYLLESGRVGVADMNIWFLVSAYDDPSVCWREIRLSPKIRALSPGTLAQTLKLADLLSSHGILTVASQA